MSGRSLVAVLGSTTPPGRLRRALVEALERVDGAETELVDLADNSIAYADGRGLEEYGDDTSDVVGTVTAARAVVLATPVYRGTYTGSLKNLLDHIPVESLRNKPVGIVAMGATDHHSLGADWQLRGVLAWFGALVAPTSVYLTSRDFDSGAVKQPAAESLDQLLETVSALAELVPAEPLGPPPLAARAR